MNMTADATTEVELRLGDEETILAAGNTLRACIEKHRVPQALYEDWKTYRRAATQREQLPGEEPVTQFQANAGSWGSRLLRRDRRRARGGWSATTKRIGTV
jgi:hypothetical protein